MKAILITAVLVSLFTYSECFGAQEFIYNGPKFDYLIQVDLNRARPQDMIQSIRVRNSEGTIIYMTSLFGVTLSSSYSGGTQIEVNTYDGLLPGLTLVIPPNKNPILEGSEQPEFQVLTSSGFLTGKKSLKSFAFTYCRNALVN